MQRPALFFTINESYSHGQGSYWTRMVTDFSRALSDRGLPCQVEFPSLERVRALAALPPEKRPPAILSYNFNSQTEVQFEDTNISAIALLRSPIVTLFMDHTLYLAETAARFERARVALDTAVAPHLYVPMEPAHLATWPFDKGRGFALPQAGPAPAALPDPVGKPFVERSIDIMLCGTLSRPKDQVFVDLGGGDKIDCMPLIEAILNGASADEVARSSLLEARPDLDPLRLANFITSIDRGARTHRRWRLAKSLLKLPVVHFGKADPIAKVTFPKWRFMGPVTFSAVDEAMGDTRIVLSDTINLHEAALMRMFYGQARGAAVASDMNAFLERDYRDGESIIVLSVGAERRVNDEAVRSLLRNPARLASLADAGRAVQAARHTWHARADALIPEIRKLIRDA